MCSSDLARRAALGPVVGQLGAADSKGWLEAASEHPVKVDRRKKGRGLDAADGALAASQKELGKDAVKVSTLSTASDDMGHTFNSLIDLAASDKSKTTQAALQAATAAAAKDRREMANAANILKESQAILGKDAIKLPSLGDPAGGPSSLFKSVLAGIGRTKQAARGHGGQGGASELDKDAGARTMGLQQDAHNFLVNREDRKSVV